MIFYFSATGNCEHVARRIAGSTGDSARSIVGMLHDGETSYACDADETIGLVVPTYAWGLPSPVTEFLRSFDVTAESKPYTFFVATFGTTPGQTLGLAQGLVAGRAYAPFDAGYCVRMPDTWTPTFDLSDHDKVTRLNETAEPQIDRIASQVSNRVRGDFVHPKTPRIAKPLARHAYEGMRETRHLHVTEVCVGCGACARRCPVQAITMRDGRPTWTVERCAMCLGCLHRCPKFAIQYDDRTQRHGQYQHP